MREQLLAAEHVVGFAWREGALHVLDQRLLPFEQVWHVCDSLPAVARVIANMALRGASAIAISAAYGVLLGARQRLAEGGDWQAALQQDCQLLLQAQPSGASPAWAVARMRERLKRLRPGEAPLAVLEAEAQGIHLSDREANLVTAQLGVELIRRHQGNLQNLLTHGNAGALATGGFGTALGVVRGAQLEGLLERLYVDETRPLLQGARLTVWELAEEGLAVSLNADAAAAHLMKTRGITWVIVGAERVAANGDLLAAIGTYQLAVSAMHHGVRFMVVAPSSSIDLALESGDELVGEPGSAHLFESGEPVAASGTHVVNPLCDVTPADLVDFLVTEKGVIERPDTAKIAQLMCRKRLH